MRAQLSGPDRKQKSSLAISLGVHAVLLALLGTLTFHYPIQELFRRSAPTPIQTLRYVRVAPEPPTGGGASRPQSRRLSRPAAMPAPRSTPVGIPAPSVPTAPSGIASGVSGDSTRSPGIGAGLRPGIPGERLITNPLALGRIPETDGQRAERALSAIYDQYIDSVRYAAAHPQRKGGDWSWGGDKGDKWGWDERGIHIGGISIPNIVLAALPLNFGPTGRNMNALTEARTDAYMRQDIKMHGDVMSEDEFKATVKRIRERVDRERRERMAKTKPKDPPCC